MKKLVNAIRWVVVAFFGIMAAYALTNGGFIGGLLIIIGGFLVAPLKITSTIREKIKLNKVLSIILPVILLFAGVLSTPVPPSPTVSNNSQASETTSDNLPENQILNNTTDKSTETSSNTETNTSEDESSSTPATAKPTDTSKYDTPQSTTCSHSSTTVKNKTNATCTQNGYTGDICCSSCNKVLQHGSQIQAIGHNSEIRNKKEATTANEGYTGDTYCKTCNTKIKSGEVIPKIKDNTQTETNSRTVYITKTGKKYHSTRSCSGLSNAKAIYDSTLAAAQSKGLDPCSKCH